MTSSTKALPSFFLAHQPLNWLSLASLVGAVIAGVFYVLDPRELLGVPLWEKPLKFLISTVVYAATFSWFYGLIKVGRRLVWWLGTLIALMLVIELVIIMGLASLGLTSHFNVSSGFHIAMWSIMAGGISMLWLLSFAVGTFLWNAPTIEPLIRNGIRWGLATGLAGMGLAFTMTSPTPDQLNNFEGIAGAHTVGVSDGGPGLPFLGWSTVGGDLRISHFVGLHGLQILPLIAIALAVVVSSRKVQRSVIHGVGVTYFLVTGVLYVQALAGESIVSPSVSTLLALAVSVAVGVLTFLVFLLATPAQAAETVDQHQWNR
jgi:hypothetical protein